MKEGWTYKPLGEVCDFLGGSQPPKNEWISEPKNGYVRMLQIRDFTKSRNVTPEYVKLSHKLRLCKEDDILIGRYGASVGKILTGLAGAYNVAIIKALPNESILDKRFIRRYFESPCFQQLLFKICFSRAAQAGFSKADIEDTKMPIPSLFEQERIVAYLDKAFEDIDKLKDNAQKQLDEARKLFQAALTEAMQPKEGWETKKIKDISDIKGGKRVPKGYKLLSTKTEHPYIRVSDFTDNGSVDLTNILYISDDIYQQIKNYTITDNDIYISIAGTIGKSGIIPSSLNGANLTENACKIVFKAPIERRYFYLFTLSDVFKKQIEKATKQASQPKLALTRLAEVEIYLPSIAEQVEIVQKLDALSDNVQKLEEINRKVIVECDALKQSILRQIFE